MTLILGAIFFGSAISKKKTSTSAVTVSQACTIGEVALFAGDFAPGNWAFCDGKALEINNYNELFSIIGTNYGGDGRRWFTLPDLVGRTAIHTGTGSGLSTINLGSVYGSNNLYGLNQASIKKGTVGGSEVTTVTGPEMVTDMYINSQPSLGLNYIICLTGNIPTRS